MTRNARGVAALLVLASQFNCLGQQPATDRPALSPDAPSQEQVKQATQVIQAAATQTSQKADSALKEVQVTQARVTEAQKQIDATAQKVDDLVATEDDDSEHALRRTEAKSTEVADLASRLGAFGGQMNEKSKNYFWAGLLLTSAGLLSGFVSVICSLKNRGTLSACLALFVIALVALNSFLKLDAKTHIYLSLAAAADSERERVLRPRLHFGQIIDSDSTLAKLKIAEGAADSGDINATLQAFVNNSTPKR